MIPSLSHIIDYQHCIESMNHFIIEAIFEGDYAFASQTSTSIIAMLTPLRDLDAEDGALSNAKEVMEKAKRKSTTSADYQEKRVKITTQLMTQADEIQKMLERMADEAEAMVKEAEEVDMVTEEDQKKMAKLEADADLLQELVVQGRDLAGKLSRRPLELLC